MAAARVLAREAGGGAAVCGVPSGSALGQGVLVRFSELTGSQQTRVGTGALPGLLCVLGKRRPALGWERSRWGEVEAEGLHAGVSVSCWGVRQVTSFPGSGGGGGEQAAVPHTETEETRPPRPPSLVPRGSAGLSGGGRAVRGQGQGRAW